MLGKTLEQVELGISISHGPLRLFPLVGETAHSEEAVALLDEALEGGVLEAREVDESGSVGALRVTNTASTPVLILEGDELVGAKQNRVLNSSVLVAAHSELILPVSCVERGRWSQRPRPFSSPEASPHLALRHLKSRSVHDSLRRGRGHRSDQGAVWKEVDRLARVHASPSPTEALQDTRAGLRERMRAFEGLAGEFPAKARGAIVAIGDRPVALEILVGPRSFAKLLPKLLSGYAMEALEHPEDGAPPKRASIERLVEEVAVARKEEHPTVGAGTDVRFGSGKLSGYALVEGGRVLHAAAFVGPG